MKIASMVLMLTILVLATLSSAAVMQLSDSDNDGVIEIHADRAPAASEIKDLREVSREAGYWYELQVQAEGNEANADPGDTDNANILVLVTYKGKPVDMLTLEDFELKTILVPPGKGAVQVKEFHNYGNGAYVFEVIPIKGVTWGAGEYDIQISVSYNGIAFGQTIASIEVT